MNFCCHIENEIQIITLITKQNSIHFLILMISFSSKLLQGEIHHVMNPDPYRGTFGSDAAAYAKEVQEHITYGSSGRVAGFIAETFQV